MQSLHRQVIIAWFPKSNNLVSNKTHIYLSLSEIFSWDELPHRNQGNFSNYCDTGQARIQPSASSLRALLVAS
jgi:hypothetical protein